MIVLLLTTFTMKKKLLLIGSLILNCVLVILLYFQFSGKTTQTAQHHYPIVDFTSHKDSLITTVMKQCVYDSCRAYLGYDSNHHFKLYLTPIKNQKDVFLNFNPRKRVNSVPDNGSYVLDLIAPCPNTCDTASALYTFIMPNR